MKRTIVGILCDIAKYDDTYDVCVCGAHIGSVVHHKDDPDWISDRRFEVVGSTPVRGYGGRLCHGWSSLGAAVTVLLRFRSSAVQKAIGGKETT